MFDPPSKLFNLLSLFEFVVNKISLSIHYNILFEPFWVLNFLGHFKETLELLLRFIDKFTWIYIIFCLVANNWLLEVIFG